jgi:S-methylmethionine-dependent homocysteine/selenocysteine methylase
MEGALGERLKREYHLAIDENLALAKLVYSKEGKTALQELWEQYIDIARNYNLPFLATTPTRRANIERIQNARCDSSVITENVRFLRQIQQCCDTEMYIGGLMGCKGDAYTGAGALGREEAYRFHSWQANVFCKEEVDFLYAGIMPVLSEAIGMAEAMSDTQIPYIISFTILKDGTLVDGTNIGEAISIIDNSVIHKPLCYMANCVHPTIVYEALSQPFNKNDLVQTRFLGIQANTSPLSYSELDSSKDLKCSEPSSFATDMIHLIVDMKLKIAGGCCGTDHHHMEALAKGLLEV